MELVLERPAAMAEAAVSPDTLTVRVVAMRHEADDILSLDLRPLDGVLSTFDAGAHIELRLPNGLRRAYSLINAPHERDCYRVAVHKSPASRGGSRYIHEVLRVGQTIEIGAPRNLFRLFDEPAHAVLIAGGIGITPIWSMVQRLAAQGRSWELHYAARTRDRAAFVDALRALDHTRVHCYFDGEPGGRSLSLATLVSAAGPHSHLYCCGPQGMLDAFANATRVLAPERLHVERFGATPQDAGCTGSAFEVVLARSGRTLSVAPDQSILDALLAAGIDVAHSCREGVCGSCESRVLDGIPHHRDSVLTAGEHAGNRTMMICCSRSLSASLTLDL